MQAAEEDALFAMQKKKMFLSQCREVKSQKDEADLYLEKQQELSGKFFTFLARTTSLIKPFPKSAAKTESVLWQIWRIRSGMEEHEGVVEALKGELEVVHSQEAAMEAEMQAAKKEVLSLTTTRAAAMSHTLCGSWRVRVRASRGRRRSKRVSRDSWTTSSPRFPPRGRS